MTGWTALGVERKANRTGHRCWLYKISWKTTGPLTFHAVSRNAHTSWFLTGECSLCHHIPTGHCSPVLKAQFLPCLALYGPRRCSILLWSARLPTPPRRFKPTMKRVHIQIRFAPAVLGDQRCGKHCQEGGWGEGPQTGGSARLIDKHGLVTSPPPHSPNKSRTMQTRHAEFSSHHVGLSVATGSTMPNRGKSCWCGSPHGYDHLHPRRLSDPVPKQRDPGVGSRLVPSGTPFPPAHHASLKHLATGLDAGKWPAGVSLWKRESTDQRGFLAFQYVPFPTFVVMEVSIFWYEPQ